jgi:hypothetical protein
MKRLLLSFLVGLCLLAEAWAQGRVVTGRITSPGEGPLPGVSVILKGTRTGVVADATGTYKINVPNDNAPDTKATLVFRAYPKIEKA